jgi:rhomboid protease GluP
MSREERRAQERGMRRFMYYYGSPADVTVALLAVLVLVHLGAGYLDFRADRGDAWGIVFGRRSTEVLRQLGGRDHDLVAAGQWWRCLAAGFLHADAMHIFFNCFAGWGLGRMAEAVFGRARFLLLFCLAVIGGNLLSQRFGGAMSVGASGGIFGLMGAMVTFSLRHHATLPPPLRAALGRDLVTWIVVNLAIGLALPFVDQAGHVGGLLAGLALGVRLGDQVTDHGRRSARNDLAITVMVVALAAAAAGGMLLGLRGG